MPRARPTKTLRVAMLLGVAALAAACGSHHASQTPQRSRSDLESIIEDETLLHTDPGKALDVMRRLGVDRVRVYVSWASIAPDPTSRTAPRFDPRDPGAYPAASLSIFDTSVREATRRGIGMFFTIGGPAPHWATGRGAPRGAPPGTWKPSASQFGAFVRAIGTRYDGHYTPAGATKPLPRVGFWSIWNEPNHGPELAPQAPAPSEVEVAPALYRGLLDAAWSALQASGHAGDTILIGETAPRGQTSGGLPGAYGGMVPLQFIRALYCVDGSFRPLRGGPASARECPPDAAGSRQFPSEHPALFHASGFADHPYPQAGNPPNVQTPDEPDYADIAALPHLERTLDRAVAAYGSNTRVPIYSTEFGYHTDPPQAIAHIDPTTAAKYLNWSEYISWRDPRVRSYDQYLLRDPPGANPISGFPTGLEFENGPPKATYDAFRMPLYLPAISATRGKPVEVWGCVRPAPSAHADTGESQRVEIQFRATSENKFKTVQTVTIGDPHSCYFDTELRFDQDGAVRLAWSYPHGPAIHSRTASIVVH